MTAAPEIPLTFPCFGEILIGILHRPERPRARGVVIVVGGPQYRAGSHRQYVMLARHLAAAGYPVLRFDYRGMGDSGGTFAGFENVDADIRAAVDTLFEQVTEIRDVALWGLCDGASAIAFYGATDPRVTRVILVNPWVRDAVSLAQTHLRHHYTQRLFSTRFWSDLLRGRVKVGKALRDLADTLTTAFRRNSDNTDAAGDRPAAPLPERIGAAMERFAGRTLLILSDNDLTAREFDDAVLRGTNKRGTSGAVVKRLTDANHTYSTQALRDQVHRWTTEWLAES